MKRLLLVLALSCMGVVGVGETAKADLPYYGPYRAHGFYGARYPVHHHHHGHWGGYPPPLPAPHCYRPYPVYRYDVYSYPAANSFYFQGRNFGFGFGGY